VLRGHVLGVLERHVEEPPLVRPEAAVEAGLADRTADDDDQDDESDDAEEARKAAASWNLHIYGAAAGSQPAASARTWAQTTTATTDAPAADPPAAPAGDGDAFAAVDDAAFTSLGEVLADLFDPTSGYDPDLVGALIRDVYADAAAPPTLPTRPPPPPTSISIDDLVDAIQEGARP